MAISDPLVVTVNAVAQSLARTGSGIGSGTFRTNDGNFEVTVNHYVSKGRNRSTIAIKQRKVAADPLISANNVEFTQTMRVTLDRPLNQGFSVTESGYLWTGLATALGAGSPTLVAKLLGNEN